MRPLLTSFGTAGDVEPLLALAVELRRAGHRPVVAFPPNYASRAADVGVEFMPIGAEIKPAAMQALGAAMLSTASRAEHTRHFLEAALPSVPVMFRQLLELSRAADVLISTPFQLAARMVHETLALPFVSIHLTPFGMLGGKEVRDASAPMVNALRADEGLAPLRDPLGADGCSPQLALYAVSPQVSRPGRSWPAHHKLVGYFFLDAPDWVAPPELLRFLAAGEPPVVVGFGSMIHGDATAVTQTLLEAIELAKCRAILQQGWSGLGKSELPENVFPLGFAPHSWLLDRAGAIVHHGGAGTTAAAFRAGIPTVVVPHTLEQPLWGECARALGCAAAVIPFAKLAAAPLAEALVATQVPQLQESARALGKKIRGEQGCRVARELIEGLVASRGQG